MESGRRGKKFQAPLLHDGLSGSHVAVRSGTFPVGSVRLSFESDDGIRFETNVQVPLENGAKVAYQSGALKTNGLLVPAWPGPIIGFVGFLLSTVLSWSGVNVLLTEVPDYTWHAGCFGTGSGNLMGFWDRHGFPNFYTGPTGDGVAPLTSDRANEGIRSLWASQAGVDGRPATSLGHMDDYWVAYESTAPDPYVVAAREEHIPDCIGDFIGLNQNKWTQLNGECDGNVDGFSFVFWDATGEKRVNYVPSAQDGRPVADIPSGLRAWTHYRGTDADVFSQLTDFNPTVPAGRGFTFADLTAEIDAGYPVLLYLQNYDELSRSLGGLPRVNPNLHGMLAYGYHISDSGEQYVRYKTSWGSSGENTLSKWDAEPWQAQLPVRGVIGYRPHPRITEVTQMNGTLHVQWEGPSSVLSNVITRTTTRLHQYVLEKATQLNPPNFETVSEPTFERSLVLPNCCPQEQAFYRLRLKTGAEPDVE